MNDSLQLDYTVDSGDEEPPINSQIYPTQAAMKNLVDDMEELEEEPNEQEEGSLSVRVRMCCSETRKEEDRRIVYKCSQCIDVQNIYSDSDAKRGGGMRDIQSDKRYIDHIIKHHPEFTANTIYRVDLIKKEKRSIQYDEPRATWWVGEEKEEFMKEEKVPTKTEQTIKRNSKRKDIHYPAEDMQVTEDKAHWKCKDCGYEAIARIKELGGTGKELTEELADLKAYNFKLKYHIMTRHYTHAGVDIFAPLLSTGKTNIIFGHYQGVTDRREAWKITPAAKIPAACEGEFEETFVEALQLSVVQSGMDRAQCGLCCRSMDDKGKGIFSVLKHIRQFHNTGPNVVYDVIVGKKLYLAHTVDAEGERFAMMPWSRYNGEANPSQE